MVKSGRQTKNNKQRKVVNDMNKRFLVPVVTGCVFATILAAGCAAHKRSAPASVAPVVISTSASTARPTINETKVVTVFKEAPTEATTTTTEATTTTTAKPTATPKPTAKPTAKPTKKPTAKPTKKPTAKPAAKKTATEPVKANTLSAVPKSNADSNQITGIYRSSWSEMTVDATNTKNVKITVNIHDQEDSSKVSVWQMSGSFNPETGEMTYSNCTKNNYTYDVNNSIASKNAAYSNGKGKIVIRNGMVIWNDYQEHIADDMTFMSANNRDHG